MAKTKRTLEEGLDNSARKKGLTGASRHRYIGGAIRNMEKRGEFTIKRKPSSKPTKAASTSHKATAHKATPVAHKTPVASPKPTKSAYSKPSMIKRTKLELVVKEDKSKSTPTKTMYAIYKKDGSRYGSYVSSKRSAVVAEAKREMDAHNHPLGEHIRGRLA